MVTLQHLIETLRNELQQYGEMLALLDQQQELVGKQAADDLLRSLSAIDTQSAAIQAARANRQLAHHPLRQYMAMNVITMPTTDTRAFFIAAPS